MNSNERSSWRDTSGGVPALPFSVYGCIRKTRRLNTQLVPELVDNEGLV